MVSYADAMENKGVEIGEEKGLKALVRSLKEYTCDFDAVYNSVIKNEVFSKVTKDQVMKYFKD